MTIDTLGLHKTYADTAEFISRRGSPVPLELVLIIFSLEYVRGIVGKAALQQSVQTGFELEAVFGSASQLRAEHSKLYEQALKIRNVIPEDSLNELAWDIIAYAYDKETDLLSILVDEDLYRVTQ